jgi:hypothetical protein
MRHLLLPFLVLGTLAACGNDDPRALTAAGTKALNSGDPKGAIASFDRALAGMEASDPDFLRASIGRCQALARTEPVRAQVDFLELARAHPARVQEPEFIAVATDLAGRGSIGPATAIAEEGMKRFPESPAMLVLRDQIGDAAKAAGDPESLKKMKGLGYTGDG